MYRKYVNKIIDDHINNNFVDCEECKFLIRKSNAQEIKVTGEYGSWNLYYCKKDIKPYDSMLKIFSETKYYKEKVTVDEQGKIIK